MSYNSEPDAIYVKKFAERRIAEYEGQTSLDTRVRNLYLNTAEVDVADPDPAPTVKIKPVSFGLAGFAVDDDVAILTVTPFVRFQNLDPEDEKEGEHADDLEAWIQGCWKQSQQGGAVWPDLIRDLRLYGRAWSCIYPYPHLWANDATYKKLVEEWEERTDGGDAEDVTDAKKDVEAFKRDNFPFRWTYIDPTVTWPLFSSERWLPEVVSIKEMSAADIEAEYEYDVGDASATNLYKVYRYANYVWEATVIDLAVPELVKSFKHDLGMNPFDLLEAEKLPPNEKGWRWKSAIKHILSVIETIDEGMSNLRHAFRRDTQSGILFTINPDLRGVEDAKASGDEWKINISPGQDETLLMGETAVPMPHREVNPIGMQFMNLLEGVVERAIIRPANKGPKSGESNVAYNTDVQVAEREYDPSLEAIKSYAERVALRFMRCLKSFAREFAGEEDTVYTVWSGKTTRGTKMSGSLGMRPQDVVGWENLMQARAARTLPINENAQVAVAQGLQALNISEEYIQEAKLGIENYLAMSRQARRERFAKGIEQVALQQLMQRAGVAISQAPSDQLQRLAQLIPNASPGLQTLIQSLIGQQPPTGQPQGMPPGPPSAPPAGPGVMNSNAANTGVPINPQVPQQGMGPLG